MSSKGSDIPGAEMQEIRQELEQAQRLVEEQKRQIQRQEAWLDAKDERIADLEKNQARAHPSAEGVKPENMIWIFGTGRGGSTWLRSMLQELAHFKVWEEPMVGRLFGKFYDEAQPGQLSSRNFIMSNSTREQWAGSIRKFILDGSGYARPDLSPGDYLVVKEPNGSIGSPLIMEALPEARMILLVRDPRDVVASVLDASRKGSWLYERKSGPDPRGWRREAWADERPQEFVQHRASMYLDQVGNAKVAYDAHRGPKTLIRYEDLRADTLDVLKAACGDLEIAIDDEELARVVQKNSWENISEQDKGKGKFYRKATPGSWREDLTGEQVEIVEEATAQIIREFYTNQ